MVGLDGEGSFGGGFGPDSNAEGRIVGDSVVGDNGGSEIANTSAGGLSEEGVFLFKVDQFTADGIVVHSPPRKGGVVLFGWRWQFDYGWCFWCGLRLGCREFRSGIFGNYRFGLNYRRGDGLYRGDDVIVSRGFGDYSRGICDKDRLFVSGFV